MYTYHGNTAFGELGVGGTEILARLMMAKDEAKGTMDLGIMCFYGLYSCHIIITEYSLVLLHNWNALFLKRMKKKKRKEMVYDLSVLLWLSTLAGSSMSIV